MQVYTEVFSMTTFAIPEIENYILLDIETTGIMPSKSKIYLIGIGEFHQNSNNGLSITFTHYLLESLSDELSVLKLLCNRIALNKSFITYNGHPFDLRFLQDCTNAYQMDFHWQRFNNLDLMKLAKKFKNILSFNSIKQKDVEKHLGFSRKWKYKKVELIDFYQKYLQDRDAQILDLLFTNHTDDLLSLIHLLPLVQLEHFFFGNFEAVDTQIVKASTHNDISRNLLEASEDKFLEIRYHNQQNIFDFFQNVNLIQCLSHECENTSLMCSEEFLILTLPIVQCELKYFLPNYKDYEFLISENQIMHKSLVSYVSKSNRRKALRNEVFLSKTSEFIQAFELESLKNYKRDFKDSPVFLELADVLNNPTICLQILHQFISKLKLLPQ